MNFGLVVHELKRVAVAGKNFGRDMRVFCDGTDKIVGFEPRLFDTADAHYGQNFFKKRNLRAEFFGHRLTRAFILRIHFVTEGRVMNVETNRDIFRFIVGNEL